MTAGAAGRTEQRPTRERILRAGVRLFQAQGYHGTGVAAILEQAHAPKGSFYHHFPGGKEDLAVATVQWLAAEVGGFLDGILAAGGGGREMILGLADHAALGLAQADNMRGSLIAVLAAEAVPGSAAIGAALRSTVEGWLVRLATGLEREGLEDAEARAREALSLVEGATVTARIAGRPDMVGEIVRGALERG